MSKFLLTGLILLAMSNVTYATDANGLFSIYLVRHAEKDAGPGAPDDPALSVCGKLRAQALATTLSGIDLKTVYSTPYVRTLDTAAPTAGSHQLEIQEYDPSALEAFAGVLLDRGQEALVVGHSNTTAVLAGLLAGVPGEEFDEDEYDRLYQVVIAGSERRLYLMHQAFSCDT